MTTKLVLTVVVAAALASAAGYWFGSRGAGHAQAPQAAGTAPAEPGGRKVLYYRNPMGLPDTSPTPK
ncbi:MAG TPA: efflux RND transporter periplasmic adaptor subunit, partial [Rubrivivax sp.]|nr:efflux RND transporter periplasmic adaptor subunit [Rubrivivax sp.]